MKTYKSTNQLSDSELNKAYFGLLGKANQEGVEVIMNFGFGNTAPYILATVNDNQDINQLFPDLQWETLEVQEGQVIYEDVTEMGDPA